MRKRQKLLTDEQWELIEPLLPEPRRRKDNRGRPWASKRACLEGILWILQTGAAWRFLPDEFPSPSTCWRRLKAMGGRRGLAGRLARPARGTGCGSSAAVGRDLLGRQLRPGKKRGLAVGKTKRGKGTKWMVLVDGQGLPLGVRLESASPAEVTLAEATLAEVRVPRPQGRPRQKPERVIADRGYDSDPLRQRLQKRGIELIAPYRANNRHRRYADGRKLRRYQRRWIVERTNAWLGQFRRLLVRHEHLLSTYRAFFYLACFWITLRHCL
jgi:transposase